MKTSHERSSNLPVDWSCLTAIFGEFLSWESTREVHGSLTALLSTADSLTVFLIMGWGSIQFYAVPPISAVVLPLSIPLPLVHSRGRRVQVHLVVSRLKVMVIDIHCEDEGGEPRQFDGFLWISGRSSISERKVITECGSSQWRA
jgi:hypothetical protein